MKELRIRQGHAGPYQAAAIGVSAAGVSLTDENTFDVDASGDRGSGW